MICRSNQEKTSDTPAWKSLMQEKIKVLREFLCVTDSLYQSLAAKHMGELSRVLEQRQILVHSMDEIDLKMIENGFRTFPEGKYIYQENKEWMLLIKDMRDLLHHVADRDQKCMQKAEFLRDEIQKELVAMRQGWKAARRYTQRSGLQPRFTDSKQ